ncbi:MAG TPA: diacylglycerol kinase family protein [Devosia sp.]|nr:diacylglycerol kinase family protein [Devosia sp.]
MASATEAALSATPEPGASRRYHVIFNPNSGAAMALGLTAETLKARFKAHGHDVTIDADEAAGFKERLAAAIASDAEVLVSAGGDGTATALAGALVGSGKTLAVLPLGSANLLARDLKIPLDLDQAIAGLDGMRPIRIDVGAVNGRTFVHKVVVGVIPSIAAAREKVRGIHDIGVVLRFAQYFIHRVGNARRTAVSITSRDTEDRIERVHAVAVANNAYQQGFGKIFSRERLDSGTLTLYVLRRLTVGDVLRLSAEMIAGRWQDDDALSIETVRSVTINAKKPTIAAMIDGEVELLETPLRFKVRPLALSVLAVPPAVETAPDTAST